MSDPGAPSAEPPPSSTTAAGSAAAQAPTSWLGAASPSPGRDRGRSRGTAPYQEASMPKSPAPLMLLLTSAAGLATGPPPPTRTLPQVRLAQEDPVGVATARFASKAPGPDDSNKTSPLTPNTTHTTPSTRLGDSNASSSHRPAAAVDRHAYNSTTIRPNWWHFWTSLQSRREFAFVEQQTQPFRSSTIRPSASSADAPNNVSRPRVSLNSFSTTAIFKF